MRWSVSAVLFLALAGAGLASAGLTGAGLAAAEAPPPRLRLPVACKLQPEGPCFLQNGFDHDPGRGWSDAACRHLSYDGHDGLDFAIPDLAAMQAGVPVLAAAAGTVLRVRDGEPDRPMGPGRPPLDLKKEAGNAVLIEHAPGWNVMYAHLRRGSVAVAVKPGDKVAAGQRIGLVGMSGQADFPHLHFGLMQGQTRVDPLLGPGVSPSCTPGAPAQGTAIGPGLFAADAGVHYTGSGVISMGFADLPPNDTELANGPPQPRALPADAAALVLWARFFGLESGDTVRLRILGPSGAVVGDGAVTQAKPQARTNYTLPKPRAAANGAWTAGAYRGEAIISRGGREIARSTAQVVLR